MISNWVFCSAEWSREIQSRKPVLLCDLTVVYHFRLYWFRILYAGDERGMLISERIVSKYVPWDALCVITTLEGWENSKWMYWLISFEWNVSATCCRRWSDSITSWMKFQTLSLLNIQSCGCFTQFSEQKVNATHKEIMPLKVSLYEPRTFLEFIELKYFIKLFDEISFNSTK